MKKKMYIHGDLVLIEDKIPADAVEVPDRQGVLVQGSQSGHFHKVLEGAKVFEDSNKILFVRVEGKTQIVHQEHGDVSESSPFRVKDLQDGEYRAEPQKAYEYGRETRVLD